MRRKPRNIVIIAVVACATTCAMLFIVGRTVNHEKNITPTTATIPAVQRAREDVAVGGAERIGGRVSWYGQEYCDKHNPKCLTASGERFDEGDLTCACADWIPLRSRILVSHEGRSVVVVCNDRGNFESKGRVLDLSKASFAELAPVSKGVIDVEIEVIGKEEL